jgi:hypothetical protein
MFPSCCMVGLLTLRGPVVNRTVFDTPCPVNPCKCPAGGCSIYVRARGCEIRASPASGRGAVPRYFFHVHDGHDLLDREGVELPGPAEAREQAIATAGEMIRQSGVVLSDGACGPCVSSMRRAERYSPSASRPTITHSDMEGWRLAGPPLIRLAIRLS